MALSYVSSNPEIELFPNVCRVCMNRSKIMKCVFSTEGTQIIEELEFCTGVLIEKDGLPSKLCEMCLTSLSIAHKFKSSCLRSDEMFRKVIKKQKIPKDGVKTEIEELACVDGGDFEYQEVKTKQELGSDDDGIFGNDDEFCETELPGNRLKNSKEKIGNSRSKEKKISKGKGKGVKTKKKLKDTLNPGEDSDHREGGNLNCRLCDTTFSSAKEQIEHRTRQHGDCEWICEICGKTFKHRASHYSHVRSHLPPTHLCDLCDYKTWHKSDLKKHIRMHKGIKNYVCEYCTRGFHNSSNLRDHIRRSHTADGKHHACPRCDRAFYASDKLKRHLDTHDNIKRFECHECHARFTRRCQWKTHLTKIHNVSIPRVRPGRPKQNVLVGLQGPPTDGVASLLEQKQCEILY